MMNIHRSITNLFWTIIKGGAYEHCNYLFDGSSKYFFTSNEQKYYLWICFFNIHTWSDGNRPLRQKIRKILYGYRFLLICNLAFCLCTQSFCLCRTRLRLYLCFCSNNNYYYTNHNWYLTHQRKKSLVSARDFFT